MSEKKFANMHYPGMKSDPNETHPSDLIPISPEAMTYYESQVLTIGEKNQRKLLSSSVIFLDSSPMATCVVKKLWEMGIGRVGLFGDSELSSAHKILLTDNKKELSTSTSLGGFQKEKFPWLTLELFKTESIDRSLEDIVRGFDLIFCSADFIKNDSRVLDFEKPVLLFEQNSKNISFQYLATKDIGAFKLKSFPESSEEEGFYFPLIDYAAGLISQTVAQKVLSKKELESVQHELRFNGETWSIDHHVSKI